MAITTLSSREFNQKVGYAKTSAKKGPVFITDRGQTTHVLLNIDDYRKAIADGPTLAIRSAMPQPRRSSSNRSVLSSSPDP